MAKKAKVFDLEAYQGTEDKKQDVEYNDSVQVPLHPELAKCMGMPSIKLGSVTAMYGLSDSGKTSVMLQMAIDAQRAGIVPILIITENKMDWSRAEKMGLDISKSKCVIREDFQYLEEVYDYISMKVEDCKKGRLPDTMIFWDSVASTPSEDSLRIDKDGKIEKRFGNQKNANVIGYYNPIIMKRVTSTRTKDSESQLGLVMVTQAYVKPAEFAGGMATIVPNGGEKIWYPLSLCLEIKGGGTLNAIVKGQKIQYGTVCKVKVVKNHSSEISAAGDFAIAAGMILPNDPKLLKDFVDENRDRWAEGLSASAKGEDVE